MRLFLKKTLKDSLGGMVTTQTGGVPAEFFMLIVFFLFPNKVRVLIVGGVDQVEG